MITTLYTSSSGHRLTGSLKKWAQFLYALTLPNINRFAKFLSLSESAENLQ